MRSLLVLLTVAGLVAGTAPAVAEQHAPPVAPLAQAHAHNDYEHDRPLLDALSHGFTSVEADIYLVDGALLVAHDPEDLDPARTLQALYLEPLRARVLAGHGAVYPGHRELFQLLADIKNTGEATYAALDRVLRSPRYALLVSHAVFGRVLPGPVTVVVSGERPREVMAAQPFRSAFYDGRIADPGDLGPGSDAALTPLVSDNWTKVFTWTGSGPMPAAERDALHAIVGTAHAAGQRVRFWETPDVAGAQRDAVWRELVAAGVDHVNTDDLAGLERFLRS